MIGTQAQFDECARIRGDFRLPAIIGLVALHGRFRTAVPDAVGFPVKILFADQRYLDLGGSRRINFLLSVTFPRAFARVAAMFGTLSLNVLYSGFGMSGGVFGRWRCRRTEAGQETGDQSGQQNSCWKSQSNNVCTL